MRRCSPAPASKLPAPGGPGSGSGLVAEAAKRRIRGRSRVGYDVLHLYGAERRIASARAAKCDVLPAAGSRRGVRSLLLDAAVDVNAGAQDVRFVQAARAAHPRTLSDAAARSAHAARIDVIALSSIVGTVEPSPHFDAHFRPASPHLRSRWERVALAHRRGVSLPPIAVLQGPDGYYVVDGRHRVSVALALGRRDIDAYVTRVST
jgi:hypothetical protein